MANICCIPWRRPPTPLPAPALTVGVVVHLLTDGAVAALKAMGVKCVRLSLYGNTDNEKYLDRAVAEGFDVLCTTYRPAGFWAADKARWPGVVWQIGNEPDWQAHTAEFVASGAAFGDVSPGLAHGTPAWWITSYTQYAPKGQVISLHAYGQPLVAAVKETWALAPAGRVTWIGEAGSDAPDQTMQIDNALGYMSGIRTRLYLYALDATDGYKFTADTRQLITDFNAGRL